MKSKAYSPSGKYWTDHIVSWESGAYAKDSLERKSFWDRVSTVFRGDGMYVRMRAALTLVKPHIKDLTVLDVGCASGRFAFELVQAGAKKVTGIDVAPAAIKMAKHQAKSSEFASQLDFAIKDVVLTHTELPSVDLVTALGVIEYFDTNELDLFMSKLKTKYFLIDFPDAGGRKRNPFTWQLRKVYLAINRCPGVYLYSEAEFTKLAQKYKFKNIRYVRHGAFDYVTNLPIKA